MGILDKEQLQQEPMVVFTVLLENTGNQAIRMDDVQKQKDITLGRLAYKCFPWVLIHISLMT